MQSSRSRNPPAGPAPPAPGPAGADGGSMLSGLLSLAAARWRWVRRPPAPPHPEPSARPRGVGAESMLSGLLSVSAAWRPWVHRILPARERPRRGEVKAAILALLVHVDHYEDRATRRPVAADAPGARSVGLPYREILKRVRARHPGGRASIMTIRSYARDAKREGMALPYRRPYSRRSPPPPPPTPCPDAPPSSPLLRHPSPNLPGSDPSASPTDARRALSCGRGRAAPPRNRPGRSTT